tara:strand:+ start:2766 stop:4034 length:1269 start_codon:yes stop_codon:yes gene_type:complete
MNIFYKLKSFFRPESKETFCKTALSEDPSLEKAIDQISYKLKVTSQVDFALVFISKHFSSDFSRLLPLLKKKIKSNIWLGCATGGTIGLNSNGMYQDSLNEPSISVTLLKLPDTEILPFHIPETSQFDLDNPIKFWRKHLNTENLEKSSVMMFIDPMMPITKDLIGTFDDSFPNSKLIGGIGSFISSSSGSLFFEDSICRGAIGILFKGAWRLENLVTKGVKPVGPIWEVESVKKNILLKLRNDERIVTPLESLEMLLADLPEREKDLLNKSLFLGVENKNMRIDKYGNLSYEGTFLVRDLLGIDPINGSVAVSDLLKVGQKVQYQSRDLQVSHDEIVLGMEKIANKIPDKPLLTILFSCFGRSKSFYNDKSLDLDNAQFFIRSAPLCGGFFQGEIGQIDGNSYLHGYTSCWAFLVKSNNEK